MDRDEAQLALAAAAGDRSALAELLSAAAPRVRAALANGIPDRWRALLTLDDVVQQASTDAVLGIASFRHRGDGSFAAWLITLARHNMLNAIRMLDADKRGGAARVAVGAGGNVHASSFDALLDEIAPVLSTPSRAVARVEARSALTHSIDALPPQYRAVVRLYDIEGRDADAVALELGRSVGAMFMLRARAHRALADDMGSASRYLSQG